MKNKVKSYKKWTFQKWPRFNPEDFIRPLSFYYDRISLSVFIFHFTYEYTLVRIIRASVHGQQLFTYTLKSTVRIVSVLSVICRQIVVSLFCYVLSSCPLDALAMTNIHNSMLRVVYLPKPGLVLFVFARLALYVTSCRTCLIVNVLAFYTNADLIARLLRERLLRSFFIIILFLSYVYIRYTNSR